MTRLAVVATVYVSSATSARVLGDAAARVVASTFADAAYQRSSVVLAGAAADVTDAVAEIAAKAFGQLDLARHAGKHPRIGVMDNIVLAPTSAGRLPEVAETAAALASRLACENPRARCLLYDSQRVTLAKIRRKTPYFGPGALEGPLHGDRTREIEGLVAFGLPEADPSVGLTCVGATPWVTNFNVPLRTTDLREAQRVAKAIRSRSGGPAALPAVEAVGLAHVDGRVEVACNLLDAAVTPPERVQRAVEALSASAQQGYVIGPEWAGLARRAEERAGAAAAQASK